MKKDRKGKPTVTSQQLINYLAKSDAQGYTIKQLSDKFGVTKKEIRKRLDECLSEWHFRYSGATERAYCVHNKFTPTRNREQG